MPINEAAKSILLAKERVGAFTQRWIEVISAHGANLDDIIHGVGDREGEVLDLRASDLAVLLDEIDRLTHLHQLDHSLADQWREKLDYIEEEFAVTDDGKCSYCQVRSEPPCPNRGCIQHVR